MMGNGPAAPKAPEMPKAPTAPQAAPAAPQPAPAAPQAAPVAPVAPQAAPAAPKPAAPGAPEPNFVRQNTKERIMIVKDRFTIGKSKLHADYSLENNSAISRTHCEIIRRNGVSYLRDLNSTNGTYVDGMRVKPGEEILLKNGSIIRLGDEDFIFHLRKD